MVTATIFSNWDRLGIVTPASHFEIDALDTPIEEAKASMVCPQIARYEVSGCSISNVSIIETRKSSQSASNISITDNVKKSFCYDNGNMPAITNDKTPRVKSHLMLQKWLVHRNMTAEELSQALDTSKSVISKLMNGKQRYNQDWLEKIAYVLRCDVPSLFKDPANPSIDDIYSALSNEDKVRALAILKTLIS